MNQNEIGALRWKWRWKCNWIWTLGSLNSLDPLDSHCQPYLGGFGLGLGLLALEQPRVAETVGPRAERGPGGNCIKIGLPGK